MGIRPDYRMKVRAGRSRAPNGCALKRRPLLWSARFAIGKSDSKAARPTRPTSTTIQTFGNYGTLGQTLERLHRGAVWSLACCNDPVVENIRSYQHKTL